MDGVLLIDFGSTYTKLTAVDIDNKEIIATSKSITTVDQDIMIGFKKAYEEIQNKIYNKNINFIDKLACSSAAGGLKMVAIGLVPELTVEAAKRAALGAGARILGVYSYELTRGDIEDIALKSPDIILLSGGTDGGNKECILYNAQMISKYLKDSIVVIAGNKNATDEIEDIFNEQDIYYKVADNVMPRLNVINVEPAREAIRKVFMEKIIEAKGMSNAEKYINGILMPTPAAVLKAARLLADGTSKEDGIGDVLVLDIGGATTDVHSIGYGEPSTSGVTVRGLQEPYAKRTVEGDLGMRVSAMSLLEAVGEKTIKRYISETPFNIEERCRNLQSNVNSIPCTKDEIEFDEAMARAATYMAVKRHVGFIESVYTPMGAIYSQVGKDLMNCRYMIGTGGVLVHSKAPKDILKAGLFTNEEVQYLKPKNPEILIDKDYILSAMGLLSEKYPNEALSLMKRYIVNA